MAVEADNSAAMKAIAATRRYEHRQRRRWWQSPRRRDQVFPLRHPRRFGVTPAGAGLFFAAGDFGAGT